MQNSASSFVPLKMCTENTGNLSEVRFAIVMYGGVSLAIYINGVAQELLHIVRSTVTAGEGDDPFKPFFKYTQLTPSEVVYRKLSY